MTTNRAYLLITISVFLLALSHVIGRAVHQDVPPVGLSFWRWTVAAACLLPFAMRRWDQTLAALRQSPYDFVLMGCLVVGSTSLLLIALNLTTATNVALMNATQPAITVLLSRIFYGIRLERGRITGVLVSFAGALVMISHGSASRLVQLEFNSGDLIALAGFTGLAGYAVRYSMSRHGLPTSAALFLIVVTGCVFLLPVYVAESLFYRPVEFNVVTVVAVVSIAVLVSVIANLLWNRGNAEVGANHAGVFMNLVPLFGALMGVTFLGESFETYHLVGLILVCAGVWKVIGRTPAAA